MGDRELLELAAKAAGIGPIIGVENDLTALIGPRNRMRRWAPLTDDGDAFRLAVQLKIMHASYGDGTEACFDDQKGCEGHIWQGFGEDGSLSEYEAARRAIVRAAAEIGRSMP